MQFHESGQHRARGRSGAEPRDPRKLRRIRLDPVCRGSRHGQRGEAGGGRGDPAAGRKVVLRHNPQALFSPGDLPDAIEKEADPARGFLARRRAVEPDFIAGSAFVQELHRGRRDARGKRHRDARVQRQVVRAGPISPVLDERDVGAGNGGDG
jgi:hypothetical protein